MRRKINVRVMSPAELRKKGFAVLAKELGWINAVRFIHQYESGQGDYTKQRHRILPGWSAEEMVARAKRVSKGG